MSESVLYGAAAIGCVASLYFLTKITAKRTSHVDLTEDVDSAVVGQPNLYKPKEGGIGKAHPFSECPEYKNCIYLDYNATTPVFPEVTDAMMPFLTTCFGNPSSSHVFSKPCRLALATARAHIGALVNAKDPGNEIYLTSCGTESDNGAVDIAIHHFMQHKHRYNAARGISEEVNSIPHIISCITEHPAVICYLRVLVTEKRIRMTVLQVDSEGFININDVKNALCADTALVTIMHSNNEVGTVQNIKEIAQCIKQFTHDSAGQNCLLLHSDGAQSLGKLLVDVQALEVDMFTIVGHKYGAPKGVAALYIRTGVETVPILVGGGQERGLRGGIELEPLSVHTFCTLVVRDEFAVSSFSVQPLLIPLRTYCIE